MVSDDSFCDLIDLKKMGYGPISVKLGGGKWLAVGNIELKLIFAGDVRKLLTI
jgi:hypothetical protein